MPTLSWEFAVVTFLSKSGQVSLACGQPTWLAIGSGMATTIGLVAIEVPAAGTLVALAVCRRRIQADESGTQASGTLALPLARPTPDSVTLACPATAAAVSAESALTTSTATHRSLTRASLVHAAAWAFRTPAISGAAATVIGVVFEQPGLETLP